MFARTYIVNSVRSIKKISKENIPRYHSEYASLHKCRPVSSNAVLLVRRPKINIIINLSTLLTNWSRHSPTQSFLEHALHCYEWYKIYQSFEDKAWAGKTIHTIRQGSTIFEGGYSVCSYHAVNFLLRPFQYFGILDHSKKKMRYQSHRLCSINESNEWMKTRRTSNF